MAGNSTPLFKALKAGGTSFYCFPGASSDISAAYQNESYKMYFSKYTLLNFPKQQLNNAGGTQSTPIYWDFDNDFKKSPNATPPQSYADHLIESLRNYVANEEVTIKESRLNSTEYYYDNNQPYTTTEKIFWKWCKKLNLIDFEPAAPSDEYFSNLAEFASHNVTDDSYFPEYLWKEREIVQWQAKYFSDNGSGKLEVEFYSTTNFRVGDIVIFGTMSNQYSLNQPVVTQIIPAGATQGRMVIFGDVSYSGTQSSVDVKIELLYNRLVQ